jgi:acyl-CoA synthetase (AMP-forming)/AMP-acid ligase II
MGTESLIAPGTGELCYRGRHIFMGYMFSPENTAATIDDLGYLHSGDVAEFDSDEDPVIPSPSGSTLLFSPVIYIDDEFVFLNYCFRFHAHHWPH